MRVRLCSGDPPGIRVWEQGSVVFCPRAGETYFFDPVATEGALCLDSDWRNLDDYRAVLAGKLGVEDDADLRRYVDQLILQFETCGLAEVESGAEGDVREVGRVDTTHPALRAPLQGGERKRGPTHDSTGDGNGA